MNTITKTETTQDQELAQKVEKYLDMFRPIFQAEGGNATLVSLIDGVATVNMGGGCEGCGGSLKSMEGGLKTTLLEKVPGLRAVEIVQ